MERKRALGIWIVLGCWLGLVSAADALVDVRLARHPALSPDGKQIAFGWRGDLWLVPAQGGVARRLTAHVAYDAHPVWSPDGRWLAFASNRYGNNDVFVMRASGGAPKRLTFHSWADVPAFWTNDSKTVVFSSLRSRLTYRRRFFYQVSRDGGMPKSYLRVQNSGGVLSPDGKRLVYTRGTRRWWRKRNKNPYHRSVWLHDKQKDTFRQLSTKRVTADFASWLGNDKIVFRSERSGTFNLWKMDLKRGVRTQLTRFKRFGIRYPRAAHNGSAVVFTRWDRLYHYDVKSSKLREVKVQASADTPDSRHVRKVASSKITEYAVSPDGKEVAMVIQGDIFVERFKDPAVWSRRVTTSSWRERDLSWSPDGRKLAFVSDRDGKAAIYIAHAGKRNGKKASMFQTLRPKLTRWTPKGARWTESKPAWSPRGKKLAFVRGGGTLVVRSFKSGKEHIITKGWNIGRFRWSPDGRWLLFSRMDRESNDDVFLVRANGKAKPLNISRHPDDDSRAVWSANGRMIAFLARNVQNRYQIRYAFLRQQDEELSNVERKRTFRRWKKAWKKFLHARRKRAKRKAKRAKRKAKRETKGCDNPTTKPAKGKGEKATKADKKHRRKRKKGKKRRKKRRVQIDLKELPFRLRSLRNLPGARGPSAVLLSATGARFYVSVSRGRNTAGLYTMKWNGGGFKRLFKGRVRQPSLTPDGRVFFLNRRGQLMFVKGKKRGRVKFRAELLLDRDRIREQKFQECWALLARWFYDPKFHGVDWAKLKAQYHKLMVLAKTNRDFDDVISMMIGELNASHLGIYTPFRGSRDATSVLGLAFDRSHTGPGLKIRSVLRKGPSSRHKSRLKPGEFVLSLNGQTLTRTTNMYRLLNWSAKRLISLQVKGLDGKVREVRIRPMALRPALRRRVEAWVHSRRALVDKLSGGKLGYAYIASMSMPNLAKFERDIFAYAYNKKGLVLDVRNNGGGWTTDMLLTMFQPKPHAYTRWRGAKKGYPVVRRPFYVWHRPVILLCNQRSVSNAEIFSHAFKNLKLGTVVGMPTYGGVISTRWARLMDGTYFGIPLRGWWTLPGHLNMENNPAVPHVIVPHSPKHERDGADPQLHTAIKLLLKQLKQ